MNEQEFWHLIEQAKAYEEERVDRLINALAEKGTEEIVDYEVIFQRKLEQSYTSALWGAAYIIMGGCSDDSFDYFRGWLIAQGEDVFHKAVADPEYLAECIPDFYGEEGLVPELEEMLFAASDAYALSKTGERDYDEDLNREFLDRLVAQGHVIKTPDLAFDWTEDDLPGRFPALWSRFGEDPLM